MTELDELIQNGWKQQFSEQERINYFKELYKTYPNNSRISYEYGGVYDSIGRESEAIPLYQEALNLGISGSFRVQTLIQMGSSYRNLDQFEESKRILQMALRESDGDPAAVITLCLTLWSSGLKEQAALLALRHIYHEEHGLVLRYKRSLGNYLDEIEKEIPD